MINAAVQLARCVTFLREILHCLYFVKPSRIFDVNLEVKKIFRWLVFVPESCLVCFCQWFVIYEHKSKLEIMYALKLSDIWKLACYLHDIWPYWMRSCHTETSKGSWNIVELSWLLAIIAYGTIAKKKAGFTPFCAFCHLSLIDGKWLFCSHTLLSNLTSPSCNLTAQRKFCCLLLFRADTKATTKTKLKSWSQYNSSSYSCVSHCFLDYFANNKSNSSSRWHVSNFKFD